MPSAHPWIGRGARAYLQLMSRGDEHGRYGESGVEAEDFEQEVTQAEAGQPTGAEAETLAEDRAAVRAEVAKAEQSEAGDQGAPAARKRARDERESAARRRALDDREAAE